jgi:type I restriction enzyme R subunit
MKQFEPAMRHLLDTYIRAEDSKVVSEFEELGLLQLIIENEGLSVFTKMPADMRNNADAMAETIENNIRKVIIVEQPVNPKYYEEMSELLEALIKQRRAQALEYQEYLEKVRQLAIAVKKPGETDSGRYPGSIDTGAKRALYDALDNNEELSIRIDKVVRYTKKADFRGHRTKERELKNAIREELGEFSEKADEVFDLVKNQREY